GVADLNTDGDGAPDGAAALAALGIDDAERAQLASLYAPGTTLWRVPISHFSIWDINWGYSPPPDAKPPGQPAPAVTSLDDTCLRPGNSVIECENQVLGESVPVTGTHFRLHYVSDSVLGHLNQITVPLTGAAVPASAKQIELEVTIAGRRAAQT